MHFNQRKVEIMLMKKCLLLVTAFVLLAMPISHVVNGGNDGNSTLGKGGNGSNSGNSNSGRVMMGEMLV